VTLKKKGVRSFEKSETAYKWTRRHFPSDRNYQKDRLLKWDRQKRLEDRQGVTEGVGERPLNAEIRYRSQDLRWAKSHWVRHRPKDLSFHQHHTSRVT